MAPERYDLMLGIESRCMLTFELALALDEWHPERPVAYMRLGMCCAVTAETHPVMVLQQSMDSEYYSYQAAIPPWIACSESKEMRSRI